MRARITHGTLGVCVCVWGGGGGGGGGDGFYALDLQLCSPFCA